MKFNRNSFLVKQKDESQNEGNLRSEIRHFALLPTNFLCHSQFQNILALALHDKH